MDVPSTPERKPDQGNGGQGGGMAPTDIQNPQFAARTDVRLTQPGRLEGRRIEGY